MYKYLRMLSVSITILFSCLILFGCDFQSNGDDEMLIDDPPIQSEDTSSPSEATQIDGNSPQNDDPNNDSIEQPKVHWAGMYLSAVNALIDEYGKSAMMLAPDFGSQKILSGVGIVKLIDFDGDGQKELYCCYRCSSKWPIYHQAIYGYDGQNLVEITCDLKVSNPSTGIMPIVDILTMENNVYLIIQHEMMEGKYYTIENNELIVAIDYTVDFWQEGVVDTAINGEVMTNKEFYAALENFNSQGMLEHLALIELDETILQKTQAVIDELTRLSEQEL